MFYRNRIFRAVAATVLFSMLLETFSPAVALALTEGPMQGEFAGSSGGGSMVDPFTGAFSYSIPVLSVPGPNGVGYSMALSYSNNLSPESEASWVGHGWSLNAGAINRIKRGYPDDYKNAPITYWRNMRANRTTQVALDGRLEAFSNDSLAIGIGGVSAGYTLAYNNYTGYDYFFNLGVDGLGASGSLNFSENGVELDGDYRPLAAVSSVLAISHIGFGNAGFAKWATGLLHNLLQAQPGVKYFSGGNKFNPPARTVPYRGDFISVKGSVQGDAFPNTGWKAGIKGAWTSISPITQYMEHAFGYLYSNAVTDGAESMDYSVENEDHYNDKDRRLPLPFSNADYYTVSGAGMGGNFRPHHRAQGNFRPAKAEGKIDIAHLNVDFHVGGGFGLGGAVGGGRTKSITQGWTNNGLSFANDPNDGEPAFFRFRGDQGGAILDVNDNAVQLNTAGDGWDGSGAVWNRVNNGERVGRSTYIDYNTNREVLRKPVFGCYWDGAPEYRSFSRRDEVTRGYLKRDEGAIADGIGEFSVVRGDGMTYVYGLPIYGRDELSMSYGLYGLAEANIDYNYLAYKHVPPSAYIGNHNLNGMEAATPYATTYLLTEVLSPDYVDRTNNGPTPDDIGGYVIFNYDRTAGAKEKSGSDLTDWYKWRIPYRGLSYSRGSFSDPYDDAGAFSSGYKEVYYLASIETKTHRALFHTSLRKDGYEADHNEAEAAASRTSTTADVAGSSKLRKLDKIELWSTDADGDNAKLLSTTYFDYDYSLCQGMPNSESNGGKLTLKRVWFEYEGVVSARISPYEFGYQYRPSSYFTGKGDISTRYGSIIDDGDHLSATEQNPDYSPYDIDPWGNYQHSGAARYDQYKTWVNQAPNDFDPAAWQLKWIKLPSGGEIHVQYEQHDYRYVQHRDAMVMVPLKGVKSGASGDRYTYELDLSETGITDIPKLVTALKKQFGDKDGGFVKDREYIYFRFLYGLVGLEVPELDQCNAEYISGYAAVTGVSTSVDGTKVYIQIGNTASGEESTLPKKICREFYKGARDGIVQPECGRPSSALLNSVGGNEEEAAAAVYRLLQVGDGVIDALDPMTCLEIDYSHSYLRIPTILDKKGGGVRVKRVLTYDPGLENEDVALYGTEYTYKTEDGRSSGVAANEPASIREENALVHLSVSARDGADTIVSGKSMRQLEEPVGESLLPGASIGYSHVVAHNIHKGKSGPGFAVYEFYTTRDFPFDMRNGTESNPFATNYGTILTPLKTERFEPYPLDLVFYGNESMTLNATQGYRFVLNNMNGQMRSITQYIGSFDPNNPHLQGATQVSRVEYDYYKPWETIPVMNGPSISDITQAYPGKTVEVVTESRELTDDMSDVNVQADFTVFLEFLFPFPVPSIAGRYSLTNTTLHTHVTNKVIEYPAILKSMVATQDGVTDRTDYAGFDPESGAPVLVKKYDGYHNLVLGSAVSSHNGTYYSVSIPAWQHYAQFGQIARSQNLILRSDNPADNNDGNTGLAFDKRFIRTVSGDEHYLNVRMVYQGSSARFLNTIASGDLIEISRGNSVKGVYHVGKIGASRIELVPVSYSFADTHQELRDVTIEIVKSARNNQVGASVGGFTTYGQAPEGTLHPF